MDNIIQKEIMMLNTILGFKNGNEGENIMNIIKNIKKFIKKSQPSFLNSKSYIFDYENNADKFVGSFFDVYYKYPTKTITELFIPNSDLHLYLAHIADFLTDLFNEEDTCFFLLLPETIFLCDKKIGFNWDNLHLYCAKDSIILKKDFILSNQVFIHPDICSGRINYEQLDFKLTNYTWIVFLLRMLIPNIDLIRISIEDACIYLNAINSKIPPELKTFFMKYLVNATGTPKEIYDDFRRCFLNSVLNFAPYKPNIPEIDTSSVIGRNKKSNQNEDAFIDIISDNSVLFMVADGVSTCDIGDGQMASQLIRSRIRMLDQKGFIKEKISELPFDDYEAWYTTASVFLKQLISIISRDMNLTIEKLMENKTIDNSTQFSTDHINTPSSTIILGVITGNWGLAASMGDSDLLVWRNNQIVYLLCPDNNLKNKILAAYKGENIQSVHDEHDKELISYLPFPAEKIESSINLAPFFLDTSDVLVAASDGLLDSINPTNSWEAGNDLNLLMKKVITENKHQKPAREIVNVADEKSGIDNITATIIQFKQSKSVSRLDSRETKIIPSDSVSNRVQSQLPKSDHTNTGLKFKSINNS